MPVSLTCRTVPAFPVRQAGRLPHHNVSRPAQRSLALRPAWLLSRPWRPVPSECFNRGRYLPQPLRLLPAGATVAGRDSHPLGKGAFHGALSLLICPSTGGQTHARTGCCIQQVTRRSGRPVQRLQGQLSIAGDVDVNSRSTRRRARVRILSCRGACTSYDRALRRNAAPSASLRRTAIEIVILPGDAIGPEISAVTRTVLESIDAKHSLGLVLTEHPIGFTSLATQGTSLPPATLEAVRAADGVILARRSIPTRIRLVRRAGSTRPRRSASHSISTPTSAPRRLGEACLRRRRTWT